MLYFIILYIILYHIISYYIALHYTTYIYIFGEKGQGGLAVFPRSGNTWCSPSSLDKVWLAALDFWRTPRPQALWQMAMDQYLYIPFLGGWTSIYQLFWCELQGYKVLTHCQMEGQNQEERPKKSIKQMEKAPMCVDECIPRIICKMTPGHWFQDISILQFLEDASSQSSWFRLDNKKISHCLWLILCGLSRRYTLWRK